MTGILPAKHGPFQIASLAAQGWIATNFPRAHRPNQPRTTGVLGRFRLTAEHRAQVVTLLTGHIRSSSEAPGSLAGLFCLLAVDALRARMPGQPWSWETVDAALPPRVRLIPREQMRQLTSLGLKFWGRPLRADADGDKRYLHSLVLEAGIPDALLGRTEFQDFLRWLQRDLDRYGATTAEAVGALAEAQRHRLPQPWRQPETLALAAELLHALQPFRAAMREGPAALESRYPDWRSALPLDVSFDAASRLVTSLLTQSKASNVALRELKALCQRGIQRNRSGVWQQCLFPPERGLLPRALATMPPFSWSGDRQPVRVRLAVEGTEIAVADSDGKGWAVRGLPIPALQFSFEKEVFAGLVVDGDEVERCALPGGDALDDAPWVFETDRDGDGRVRLIGCGSRASGNNSLFVAVDLARGHFELRSGTIEERGEISGTRRVLHEVTGHALWREQGEPAPLHLRTGTTTGPSGFIAINVQRPRWEVAAPLVSLGAPTVSVSAGKGQLLWRRRGVAWSRLVAPLPPGAAELALIENDEILDSRRVTVLPAGAEISCRRDGNRYLVELLGLGATAAFLPGATREVCDGGYRFILTFEGLPPAELELTTLEPDGLELRHRLRIPMPQGGFIGADGRPLQSHAALTFPDIDHVLCRGGAGDDYPELQIRLAAPRNSPLAGVTLGRVVGFVQDLPLARLRPDLRRMHATADARDGEISLCVLRAGTPGPMLRLSSFNVDVAFDRSSPRVELRDMVGRAIKPPEHAGLVALCPARPGDPLISLVPDERSGWRPPPEGQPGPWLILGAGALSGHVRPRIWPEAAISQTDCPFGKAATLDDQLARDTAFDEALVALAGDPFSANAGVGWDFLDATLDATTYAPAGCFDLLVRVVKRSDVLAHWLLRADERRMARLAALEDELPFSWVLVPLTDWRAAAEAAQAFYATHGLDPKMILADQLERIVSLCGPALAGDWTAREVLGLPQRANMPANVSQARAMAPLLAVLAGVDPGAEAWSAEVMRSLDWNNLSDLVRNGAPHAAARHAVYGDQLAPRLISAIRFCRHSGPDEFDSRYLIAVFHHIGQSGMETVS
jgi:hypothetical protein